MSNNVRLSIYWLNVRLKYTFAAESWVFVRLFVLPVFRPIRCDYITAVRGHAVNVKAVNLLNSEAGLSVIASAGGLEYRPCVVQMMMQQSADVCM